MLPLTELVYTISIIDDGSLIDSINTLIINTDDKIVFTIIRNEMSVGTFSPWKNFTVLVCSQSYESSHFPYIIINQSRVLLMIHTHVSGVALVGLLVCLFY